MQQETKQCQNCKDQFVIESEDFDFYRKISVSPPTFCPSCREQRRMAVRNERFLYKDQCDLCKKSMISIYSPEKPFTVYCRECWNGDGWDPLAYGREYNWNKPFFKQFRELIEKVPRLALAHYRSVVNSEYANFALDVKNTYLSQSTIYSENIYYSHSVDYCKDCFDSFGIKNSEVVYGIVDGARNYRSKFFFQTRDCIGSSFLSGCVNCQNCFMSSNLRNKQYVFRNTQLTKDAYKKAIEAINLGSHKELEDLKKEFKELVVKSLHKFANITKGVNCTGDNIENAKNVHYSFNIYDSQDIKFSSRIVGEGPVYDTYGGKAELMYEGVASGLDSHNIKFIEFCDSNKDISYADWCRNSSDLFGCTALRNENYCILNKKYTGDEYKVLVQKVIKHMNDLPYVDKKGREYRFGEFFPIEISAFAYNETLAEEHRPLSREKILEEGYEWRDPDPYLHKPTLESRDLPDDIKDVQDSIINEVIGCSDCGRAYRVIQPELDFLRQNKIALPRVCSECRHRERFAMRNPLKLWHRQCVCDYKIYENTTKHSHHSEGRCPNEFETSYSPERKEIVYCEKCYQAEVV